MAYLRRRSLWLCLIPVPALLVSSTAFAEDSFNLKRVYKTGESDKYRTTVTIDAKDPKSGNAVKIVLAIATTDETKEIKFDGTTILAMKVDSATVNVNGTDTPVPINGASFSTTLDKTGKVASQDLGAGPAAQIGQLLTLTRLSVMPDRALKAGEEYKLEMVNKG